MNSPPLTMKDLRGKVVLLDFWTYSCVNCIRTLPHMRSLHDRYSGDSFVLIGVHTPEFQFEKSAKNVSDAAKRFNIRYPVGLDNDNVTWKLYGNQYWPRQTLIDSRGKIRWEHAGEGDYDEMEDRLRKLLQEAGNNLPPAGTDNRPLETPDKGGKSNLTRTTSEIYLGSLRSKGFGNGQVCVPGSCTRFIDPQEHERDLVYFHGEWTQLPECVIHSETEPGYAVLKYTARNANAVLGASNPVPVRVGIELDGKAVERNVAGADVELDDLGTFLRVKENRLYDLVRTANQETHELKVTTDSDSLCLYTYTFG